METLVVMGIISVMMALLSTSLANARSSARDIHCQLNLRQMMSGWITYINQSPGTIPYTRNLYKHPNWKEALDSVADPEIIFMTDQNGRRPAGCPDVWVKYRQLTFTVQWGYAINTIWKANPDELNELKPWVAIRHPSSYPWFLDPQPYSFGTSYNVAHRVPYEISEMGQDKGIGANHAQGTRANVAFADGSLRSVPISEPRQAGVPDKNYAWLASQ